VHDEIMQMELGYETVVGTARQRADYRRQKQRICVAAALLKERADPVSR